MSIRRMIGFSGALLVASALTMTLPGCGGGSTETGPNGEVKAIPAVNPAPGSVSPDKESPVPAR